MAEDNKYILHEPSVNYEKAELDLLKNALSQTYTERFNKLTTLIKVGAMLKNAKLTHKPFPHELH
jgi:hypothetical protein